MEPLQIALGMCQSSEMGPAEIDSPALIHKALALSTDLST
jgi:hypothetical protein